MESKFAFRYLMPRGFKFYQFRLKKVIPESFADLFHNTVILASSPDDAKIKLYNMVDDEGNHPNPELYEIKKVLRNTAEKYLNTDEEIEKMFGSF